MTKDWEKRMWQLWVRARLIGLILNQVLADIYIYMDQADFDLLLTVIINFAL